jgi:hypothetical protein
VIGFGHRPTAITIRGRANFGADHWPVSPLLLMPRRPVFPESLVDPSLCLFSEFGARHSDLERWFLRVTGEGLRRPTPTAIKQRHRSSNARALIFATLRDFEESFESGVSMCARKLADLAVAYRPAAWVAALSFSPWHCSRPVLNRRLMSA